MSTLLLVSALGIALVSFLTSVISLMIHYGKRAEHPLTAPLEQQIAALQLGQADIIDRVDHWTRRDRTRRMRAEKLGDQDDQVAASPPPMTPMELKQQLRAQALQLGVVK